MLDSLSKIPNILITFNVINDNYSKWQHVLIIYMLLFLATIVVVYYLTLSNSILNIADVPNERSMHVHVVPRTGGIGIVLAILVTLMLYLYYHNNINYYLIIPLILISGISFIDDLVGLNPILRLAFHALAGIILIIGVDYIDANQSSIRLLAVAISVVSIVWIVNLYNFMDGIDGLSGGMAVIGFMCIGYIAIRNTSLEYSVGAFVIASTVAGFLVLNLPPARIFMGDTGSITLGMLVSIFTILGIKYSFLTLPEVLIIFSVFIVDATVTLCRRAIRLEAIWKPHKTHYYQQMASSKLGKQRTLYIEYLIMLSSSIIAISIDNLDYSHQVAAMLSWYIIMIIGYTRLDSKSLRTILSI